MFLPVSQFGSSSRVESSGVPDACSVMHYHSFDHAQSSGSISESARQGPPKKPSSYTYYYLHYTK
jgi:hypothetical protein